jgi:hypothetical protein
MDEILDWSFGALSATADKQVQASTKPPKRFRITLPLSHPGLSTVVLTHRRLMSLYGAREIGHPPFAEAQWEFTTTRLRRE